MTQASLAIKQTPRSQLERAQKVRVKMEFYYGSRTKAAKATGFWLFLNTFGASLTKDSFGYSSYSTYVYDLNDAEVL